MFLKEVVLVPCHVAISRFMAIIWNPKLDLCARCCFANVLRSRVSKCVRGPCPRTLSAKKKNPYPISTASEADEVGISRAIVASSQSELFGGSWLPNEWSS